MNKAQKKPLQLQDSLAVRILICVLFPLIAFAGLLLSQGKSPLVAYQTIITSIFGSAYGFGEVIVRASYLILTGLAASIPAVLAWPTQAEKARWRLPLSEPLLPEAQCWQICPVLSESR